MSEGRHEIRRKENINSPENGLSYATKFEPPQYGQPCWTVHLGQRLILPNQIVPEDQDKEHGRPDISQFQEYKKS